MRLIRVLRVVGLVCLVGGLVWMRVLAFQAGAGTGDPFYLLYGSVLPAAYLVPGVILLLRRRWHVVGQLLCLFAVGVGFAFASDWGNERFGGIWVVWLLDAYEGSPFWLALVALLVVFPDGLSAQTPRQRVVGRTVLVVAVVAAGAELLVTEVRLAGGELVASPLGIAFVPRAVEDNVTIVLEFAALAVAFGGMVLRYRSAHAAARRQYRWVLSAIVALVVALLIGLVGSELSGQEDGGWWFPILFAYLAVPFAFMVAILRYRLYEIDRLVSRTITYSVVVAVLGAVYVLAVGLLTEVLPLGSNAGVAASTLTVAAVFRPLQRRVQRGVDRRFNRTRFDARREVDGFARGLREQTDLQVVASGLVDVVERTLRPSVVGLWLTPVSLAALEADRRA